MGWVTDLTGQTVGVDTSPFIYLIEEHAKYGPVVEPFFRAVSAGDIQIATSVITLIEVLVHPMRHGDEGLAQKYNDILLSSPHISTSSVTPATAQFAAELRADHNLKTPDAIQLATAVQHNAAAFLTNDRDFPSVSGIQVLKLRDLITS